MFRRSWKRFFGPSAAFPVLARGVSVYTIWNHAPAIPDTFTLPPMDSLQKVEKLGSWYTIQLVWKPSSAMAETPWIDASEAAQALPVLSDYLEKLAAIQPAGHPGKAQARPVFYLLHVRELKVLVPRFYRLRYHKSKQTLEEEVLLTRRAFVEELQGQHDLLDDTMQSTSLASAFDHYDRSLHSRGWIIISLSRALLLGVNDKAVQILINLIQRRDIDSARHRISPDRYDDVLGRLSIWSSSQEVGETMDQLGNMIDNGNIAINGQVLLSLVLTLMGVVLSIYSILQPKDWQTQLWISLGILFGASLFFWAYARFGARIWMLLGLLAIVATVLFDTAALWFGPLMHILSRIHL